LTEKQYANFGSRESRCERLSKMRTDGMSRGREVFIAVKEADG